MKDIKYIYRNALAYRQDTYNELKFSEGQAGTKIGL